MVFKNSKAQIETDDEFPTKNDKKKKTLDPRWQVRIQAVVLVCFLVFPGNLVTLFIYTNSEGIKNFIWNR